MAPRKPVDDDEQEVTVTKGTLRKMVADAIADDKRDPKEREARKMIREEVAAAIRDIFSDDDENDDDDEGEKKAPTKGALAKVLGIGG